MIHSHQRFFLGQGCLLAADAATTTKERERGEGPTGGRARAGAGGGGVKEGRKRKFFFSL